MASKKVAVVIPFYKSAISAYEEIALAQCEKVLSGYDKIAIKPNGLELSSKVSKYNFAETISFDNEFFAGIQGYNKLMLSPVFYKAFLGYEYILIYQLDAFVFKDELTQWCNRGFDYIGAPWVRSNDYPDMFKAVKSKIQYYLHTRYNVQKNGMPSDMQFENKVGNGGLSLRRVALFYKLAQELQPQIELYEQRNEDRFNEDAFWSIEVNRKKRRLKIPSYQTALGFSIENHPERCFKLNRDRMPFGCHAWDKHLDFWRPLFKQQQYDI